MNDLSGLPSYKVLSTRMGFLARKSLGQHFPARQRITDTIVRHAGDITQSHVIEIGPGPGGLTRSLLRAGAKTLTVIEKDDRCLAIMAQIKDKVASGADPARRRAGSRSLTAVPSPRRIVANLPYNVGTLMLTGWLDAVYSHGQGAFESMTLMFRRKSPSASLLSRVAKGLRQAVGAGAVAVRLPLGHGPAAGRFRAAPKVSSAVITLTPRAKTAGRCR